jgi:hypothetical protein
MKPRESSKRCRVCGEPVDAFQRSHLPAPEVCDKCDPSRDQRLAWIEEMEPGAVLVVKDLTPNVTSHDPRRKPAPDA